MKRRDFNQLGSLFFTTLGLNNIGFSFVPDGFYEDALHHNRIPFRKPARRIEEVVPGFLWADAGDFQDYGGWAFDTQHVGFMGSSNLIAHGAGRPVDPARLTIPAVQAGTYRIWVRSRDWIPAYSPGRFALVLNGSPLKQEFGASGREGWIWEDGGVHELPAGKTALELQDRTGYFGRCSSVLLTRDVNYTPPTDLDTFRSERARFSGYSNTRETVASYDVVVVGAGSAGCCAAIAAARMGARTALVTDRPLVGGNASIELGVPICSAAQFHLSARETGIIEEAGRLGFAQDWGKGVMSRQFDELIKAESNLDLHTNLFVEGVEKAGGARIQTALARNTLTGEPFRFPGQIFIDATGDGWLGHHAGADCRVGREARHEYNESRAPEKADGMTMSGCLRAPDQGYKRCIFLRTNQAGSPKPFDPPAWIYQDMPPFDAWRRGRGTDDKLKDVARSGTWWLEHPNTIDDLNDPEHSRDELIRTLYTFWHMVKNEWPERNQIANFELVYVPFSLAKRETRRLIGDHVLSQNEVTEPAHFEDAVGHSGWNLDIHHPDGIRSAGGAFDFHDILPISEIPYRSLYSRNIDNLMMAGRNASVSHVAMGTTRVQGQTCVMGQAAGTAAVLALLHGTTPRGVYQNHMRRLQQTLLKHDQYIPGVANEDSADLARKAQVRASSHTSPDQPEKIVNGTARPVFPTPFASLQSEYQKSKPAWVAGNPMPEMNCWQSAEGKGLPQWIELEWDQAQTLSSVHCVFDTDLDIGLNKQSDAFPAVCVRDYRIDIEIDGGWKTVLLERGNFQRFRRHRVEPVKTRKLRLTVEATHGAPFARIFEIRCYAQHHPLADVVEG